MYHSTDRIVHTMVFVTLVVEHWLEWKTGKIQWLYKERDENGKQSFIAILTHFDEDKLELVCIMEWSINGKTWVIYNDHNIIRASYKSLFRNNVQHLSSIPQVGAMKIVHIIPISNHSEVLSLPTFNFWKEGWGGLDMIAGYTLLPGVRVCICPKHAQI